MLNPPRTALALSAGGGKVTLVRLWERNKGEQAGTEENKGGVNYSGLNQLDWVGGGLCVLARGEK